MSNFRRFLMGMSRRAQQQSPVTTYYFSISSTKKVIFSKGNLQYNPVKASWRFAENQYDYIGSANAKIKYDYDGWIDLFGWGCSGWASGATIYSPIATTTNGNHYYPGGSYLNDIDQNGNYAEADWAWHNTIGEDAPHTWRTLTLEEWTYLRNRTDKSGIGKIEDTNGLILLPDIWVLPSTLSFTPEVTSFSTNSYTVEQWKLMENNGAIFLPLSGIRLGTSVTTVNTLSCYWSTTHGVKSKNGYGYLAYCAVIGESRINGWEPNNQSYRCQGMQVRPVKEISI